MAGQTKYRPRLLRTPRPLSDESLLGYILRLTECNYYDSPRWILQLAGWEITLTNGSWLDFFSSRADFARFALAAGLPQPEIEELGYRRSDTDSHVKLFGARYPLSGIWNGAPKICPACLRESPHCRKLWDLLPVTLHHMLLINRCPGCRKPLTWARHKVSQCRCGFDWREGHALVVDGTEVELAAQIVKLCQLAAGESAVCGERPDHLSRLELCELERQLSLIASYCKYRQDGHRLTSTTELAACHEVYVDAYMLLANVPGAMLKFFEKYQLHKRVAFEAAGFVKVLDQLEEQTRAPSALLIRQAFEAYLKQSWTGTEDEGLLRLPTYRRLIGKEEAQCKLGLDTCWFNLLVEKRELNGVESAEGLLIDARSVDRLLEAVASLLSVWEAADRLNLPEEAVIELVRQGCLRAASGPNLDGFSQWRFTPQAISELRGRIEQLIPEEACRPDVPLLSTFRVAEELAKCGLSFADFLRAVMSGEVRPYRTPAILPMMEKQALLRVSFTKEEVARYIEAVRPEADEEPVTLKSVIAWLDRKFEQNERMQVRKCDGAFGAADLRRAAQTIFASYRFREWDDWS